MKISPANIEKLEQDEIFVFGSNLSGIHGGGAAKKAHDSFGAIWGNGIGIQGRSYAIPTKYFGIKRTLYISEIRPHVHDFIEYAQNNRNLKFLVTEIGCGLAGYIPEEIAPLFCRAMDDEIENIYLPKTFWSVLESLRD